MKKWLISGAIALLVSAPAWAAEAPVELPIVVVEKCELKDLAQYVDAFDLSEQVATALQQTGMVSLFDKAQLAKTAAGEMPNAIARQEALKDLEGSIRYRISGSVSSATKQEEDRFAFKLVTLRVVVNLQATDNVTNQTVATSQASGTSEAKIFEDSEGIVISGAKMFNSHFAKAAQRAIKRASDALVDQLVTSHE